MDLLKVRSTRGVLTQTDGINTAESRTMSSQDMGRVLREVVILPKVKVRHLLSRMFKFN